ncbi:hypothetical protein SDC9_82728 [bioreactor metagenome]|uniref:Uncharacterized protein n=1 Tax=bioreactor metagenome TaxID=1076179 RepID=A0A644ZBN5_9ZZZZ
MQHDLDALELLHLGVAGGGEGALEGTHEVHRAVGAVRRAHQDLLEGADDREVRPFAARQLLVPGLGAPVVAMTRRLRGGGQRSADHHSIRADRDRLGDVTRTSDRAVGDHVDVAPAGLVEIVTPGLGHVGDRGGHRDLDAEDPTGRVGRRTAEPHQDTGRTGAHQVQGALVGGAAADDHRDVELVDELLQVERFASAGDMFGGDHGAADDEEVGPGGDHVGGELGGVLRGQRSGDRDARVAHLGHPLPDQCRLDRFGVDLLEPPGGRGRVLDAAELLQQRSRVVVAGPDALEIEHPETTEPAHLDRGLRRHDGVHRRSDEREVEAHRVDLPGEVHLLDTTRTPLGNDRDVVQGERGFGALAPTDVVHDFSFSDRGREDSRRGPRTNRPATAADVRPAWLSERHFSWVE